MFVRISGFALVFAAALAAAAVSQEGMGEPPRPALPPPAAPVPDLKFTAEVVGDVPLPYQAVRLRITVENAGKNAIKGIPAPEDMVRVTGFRSAAEKRFREWGVYPLAALEERGPNCGQQRNRGERIELAPGERRSVTFPVAIHTAPFGRPDGRRDTAEAMFTKPGDYVLRCEYAYGETVNAEKTLVAIALTADVPLTVGKPAAGDQVWIDALTPTLTRKLLDPCAKCSGDDAKLLRELMKKAPESSFVNYARFALARYHLLAGDPKFSYRVNNAFAADELWDAFNAKTARDGFPFRPHVLLWLRVAAAEEKDRAETKLYTEHRDALEWLDVVASKLTREEWQEFRKPPPPNAARK